MNRKVLMTLMVSVAGISLYAQCCGGKAVPAKEQEQVTATAVSSTVAEPAAKLPKLVDLGAKKCIPCKKMAPILDELTSEYAGIMDVEFIDVWQEENVPKAQKYGIESIPTQIFLDADGKELWRHEGFISKEDILEKLKSLGYDLIKMKSEKAAKK